MKDKQKFISSVIVSLLAGFIYYMFGQDINQNFEASVKTILSTNEIDEHLKQDFMSFNLISKSNVKNKNSKFYLKKKNTIELRVKGVSIDGEEMFSDLVVRTQARLKRSIPDKEVNFSAELEQLMKDQNGSLPSRQFKIEKRANNSGNVVADTKESKTSVNFLHKSNEDELGNGFEYNYIVKGKNNSQSKKNKEISDYTPLSKEYNTCNGYQYNSDYNEKSNEFNPVKVEYKTKVIRSNGQKISVIIPVVKVNVNKVDIKIENDMEEDNDMRDIDIDVEVNFDTEAPEADTDSDQDTM
ncbi:MAG: hypothetical protein ABI528_08570 [bacterium]